MIQNDTKLYCVQIHIINLYIVKRKRQLISDKKLYCKYVLKRIMLYQQRPYLATHRNSFATLVKYLNIRLSFPSFLSCITNKNLLQPWKTLWWINLFTFIIALYLLYLSLSYSLETFLLRHGWHTYMLCVEINYIYLLTIVYSQFKVMNAFGVLVF